jgi:hypothetical protein
MRRAEPAERAERISTPSAVPEVSGRNLRGLGRASGVAEVAETISNAERAGEFLVKSSAASALSAFNPCPRPRVRPRGSGRVRGDNLNAERAEHAGEFLVKSSVASALSALIRLRDLGCVRAGVAECAETI